MPLVTHPFTTLLIGHSPRQKVIPETNLCLAASLHTCIWEDPYALVTWMLIGQLHVSGGNR